MRASPFYAESSAGAALDLVLPRGTSATVTSVTERDEISLLYEAGQDETVPNLCLGLSGQVFGQNFNSTRLWIRAVPGFRSASRSPGSGARRDVRGAPRQKNRRSGWFRRPSHSSPTVTFPMGNQSDPPGTKGCAHKPVGLDREEGGFGRFTARRSMHPVCIARARAASCRT
jgi:hypothetical protein